MNTSSAPLIFRPARPSHGHVVNCIPILETERLILRPFTLDDASDVQRLAGDRLIADTTGAIPHPYEAGMAEEWIATHKPEFESGKGVSFAITDRNAGSLIGAISLMGMSPGHKAELGYWIGRPFWNQGFCTEAARAVVRYAFKDLDLVRVHSSHYARNPASGRVLRKIGLRHEGLRRCHVRNRDRLEDLEIYGLLKSDWTGISDPLR